MDAIRVTGSSPVQRWVGIPLLLLVALVLQAALFAYIPLFGALPELTLLVAIAVAIEEGPEWGAATGFAAGLLMDLIGALPLGVSALSYCLVCYFVGWFRDHMSDSPLAPLGVVAVATAAGQGFVLLLTTLFGQGTRGVGAMTVFLTCAYNVILGLLVLPLVHLILRPRASA